MRHIHLYLIALLLLPRLATAADGSTFEDRVAHAKKIETQKEAMAYFSGQLFPAIEPAMSAAMTKCMAQPNANNGEFVVVADVSSTGKFVNIDFEPKTNTARCFASAVATFRTQPPPKPYFGALPIVLEMSLEP